MQQACFRSHPFFLCFCPQRCSGLFFGGQEKFDKFLEYQLLRKETLNQTFNFIPMAKSEYQTSLVKNKFDTYMLQIANRYWV